MASMTLPQAAATLAVTITAEEFGLLDEVGVDSVIIVIVVTCLVGPLLTSWIGKRIVDDDHREPATGHEDQKQARAAPMHERSDKPS